MVFAALYMVFAVNCAAKDDNLDMILSSAEKFFQVLKANDYRQTWSLLSTQSRHVIIEDMYKGLDARYSREQIRSDLTAGGMIAAGYWRGVLQSFDPKSVLEESAWEVGEIGPKKAELLVTNKKSSHPARLQMFHEDGAWKIGLVESFWTRK